MTSMLVLTLFISALLALVAIAISDDDPLGMV
jgi:hypothetical protein